MYRLLIINIGIVACTVLAMGCGSSGDGDATVQPLTKAEFVKQAEGVCAAAIKQRTAAAADWRKEHPGNISPADLDNVFREVVAPSVEEQVEALEALPAPLNDKAELKRMVRNLAQGGRDIARQGTRAAQSPEMATFLREATKYGLKNCARLY